MRSVRPVDFRTGVAVGSIAAGALTYDNSTCEAPVLQVRLANLLATLSPTRPALQLRDHGDADGRIRPNPPATSRRRA